MAKLKKEGRNLRKPSNPLQQLTADEDSRLMYEAMCRLELEEYIVIVLHYIQGLSFREMAKVLDEAVGTVKWRTSKTLKKLKAFLSGKV
jgi:RNA polymerase sigma factor (sigma-70 family)